MDFKPEIPLTIVTDGDGVCVNERGLREGEEGLVFRNCQVRDISERKRLRSRRARDISEIKSLRSIEL